MTPFDLLFLLCAGAALITLGIAVFAMLGGRPQVARRLLSRLLFCTIAYFAVLLSVSLTTSQQYKRIDEAECSDDWCMAAHAVQRDSTAANTDYLVTFRIENRARRAAQREQFVAVYLLDSAGAKFYPTSDNAVPFDTLLQPGEVLDVVRRFTTPPDARMIGAVVTRDGAGWFPRCCIIGEQGSLFHKHTVVKF